MSDVPLGVETVNILLVGECGDGKSTLVNALRDPTKSQQAMCGKNAEGVTKDIVLYPCRDLSIGKALNILDTPGVGDHHVLPTALVSMIEEFLKAGMVPGGVRGVVVTTPIPDGRVRLGAQIVQAIVDKGFVAADGEDKYGNIILCGTKLDKADEEEKHNFLFGAGGRAVQEIFFEKSPKKTGPCVMVCQADYTPLLDAIRNLPATAIRYEKPKSDVMAAALAAKLGMKPEELQSQIDTFRKMVESQSQQIQELMQQLHGKEQAYREDMAKKDKMLQEMMMKMQEDQKQAAEARLKREAVLEEMHREQNEERCKERAEAAEFQRQIQKQMEQEAQRTKEMCQEMQKRKDEAEQRHGKMIQQMQENHREAIAAAAARSSGGGGGGCCIL